MSVPFLIPVTDDGTEENHQPYTAFNQGFDAAEFGARRKLNPYPSGIECDWWDDGWDCFHGRGKWALVGSVDTLNSIDERLLGADASLHAKAEDAKSKEEPAEVNRCPS